MESEPTREPSEDSWELADRHRADASDLDPIPYDGPMTDQGPREEPQNDWETFDPETVPQSAHLSRADGGLPDWPGLAEPRGDAIRRERADQFMAGRASMLRGMVLSSPIATLDEDDPERSNRLLGQLDLVVERSQDVNAGEALAKELIRIFLDEGGDPERVLEMLRALVFTIPTGPVGTLWLAAKLLAAAST